MATVLCTMAVVVLMAIAGCLPDQPANWHCTQGPGWRSDCRERQSGVVVHPSGLDRRTDGVTQEVSVRHPGHHAPPGCDPGRAEVERVPSRFRAPSAPSAPAGAAVCEDGARLRAAFNRSIALQSGYRGRGMRGSPPRVPRPPSALVDAAERQAAAPTRLHRVRTHD